MHDTMHISYKISNVLLKKISHNCYKKKNEGLQAVRKGYQIQKPGSPSGYQNILTNFEACWLWLFWWPQVLWPFQVLPFWSGTILTRASYLLSGKTSYYQIL